MAIKRRKRGNRVYLEEYRTVRRNGKVFSEFVRYLGPEGDTKKPNAGSVITRVTHGDSKYSGAVRLLWSIAQDLHFAGTIDSILGANSEEKDSPGKMLVVWAINRVLDPASATKLERWVNSTELPELTGIEPQEFNKDHFLYTLDKLCVYDPDIGKERDHIRTIDGELYKKWRDAHPLRNKRSTIAYDLTNVLFFGVSCSIAKAGANSDHQNRLQVNVAVAVDREDNAPIIHFVYDGNRNGASTVKNLLVQLQQSEIKRGLLLVDRGIMNGKMVEQCRAMEWRVLGGVSKHLKDVQSVLLDTSVSETPQTLACVSRSGPVYATNATGSVFGVDKNLVVYTNAQKALRERRERNSELKNIGKALDFLSSSGNKYGEAKLHKEIGKIVGVWKDLVNTRVSRKGPNRIAWAYNDKELANAAKIDGKYLLLCTETQMSSIETVETYFSKDFVEKSFRTLKISEDLEPVRHRLSNRVRAYVFVCMLAYRLEMALRASLTECGITDETSKHMERLLYELSNVQKVGVRLGVQQTTWYLNVTDFIKMTLVKLGRGKLFSDGNM